MSVSCMRTRTFGARQTYKSNRLTHIAFIPNSILNIERLKKEAAQNEIGFESSSRVGFLCHQCVR